MRKISELEREAERLLQSRDRGTLGLGLVSFALISIEQPQAKLRKMRSSRFPKCGM